MSVCASLVGDLVKDKLATTLSAQLVFYEQAASMLVTWWSVTGATLLPLGEPVQRGD